MKSKTPSSEWLSTAALAKLLGRSERTVRWWLAKAHQAQQDGVRRNPNGRYQLLRSKAEQLIQ